MQQQTCPISRTIDFNSQDFHLNPSPALARLREQGPVQRTVWVDGHEAWLVTRFAEVQQVFKDPRLCLRPPRPEFMIFNVAPVFMRLMSRSMAFMDEPDHTRLRSLVSKAFTPRLVEGLRPRIQQLADELIDRVLPHGRMEFIDDFALPLPVIVIAELLGVPVSDQDRLREWSLALANSTTWDLGEADLAKAEEFEAYIHALLEQKRREPREDLLSQLVRVEEGGSRLAEDELLSMVTLLLIAGHETTVNLLGNSLLALFNQPAELERLKADRSLIPSAVEELLRLCGPVISVGPRFATEDLELGGQLIRKGERIVVLVPSANQDEQQFANAQRLDVARAGVRHLAFGQGIHFCLGAPLARLEMQVALDTLLRRLPGLRLEVAPESLEWRPSAIMRSVRRLPVAF